MVRAIPFLLYTVIFMVAVFVPFVNHMVHTLPVFFVVHILLADLTILFMITHTGTLTLLGNCFTVFHRYHPIIFSLNLKDTPDSAGHTGGRWLQTLQFRS